MLKGAHESNCPVNNRLDILKWARQQQAPCPWWSLDELDDYDEYALIHAQPSTLLWLAQQGAPLPEEAYDLACSSAHWLAHAYIALRALLPAEILLDILTLSME